MSCSLGHFQYTESQQGQWSHGDFICPMTEWDDSMDFLLWIVKGTTITHMPQKRTMRPSQKERGEVIAMQNNEEQ